MAVTFEPLGRLYYFDPGQVNVSFGQQVLVPSGAGPEVATCVWGPVALQWDTELPELIGLAQSSDLDRDARNRTKRAEIAAIARRLISQHELDMRVVGVDYVDQSEQFDQLAVVYFEAPGRVDFRALIPDLARALKARIDLRQIGSRDAAAILGGVGACGREYCCASIGLPETTISLKLARTQDLPANPAQLLGGCGRLMCCLAYEHDLYREFRERAPGLGTRVATAEGTGRVVGHVVPLDAVMVQVGPEQVRCPLAGLGSPDGPPRPSRPAPPG